MAKKELTELEIMKRKNKEIVNAKIHEVGPSMVAKMIRFIDDNFENEEDKDMRRDAHKLAARLYDSIIPKTQVIESNTTNTIQDKRFEMFVNAMTQKAEQPKQIEVEEAEVVSDEEARKIRDELRGK
jgi:hypothetical protein